MDRETRVIGSDQAVVLLARAFRVVAQRLHAVGGLAPDALHVVALVRVDRPVVARDADLVARIELADDLAALAQPGGAQALHHARAIAGANLQQRTELLGEERREREVLRLASELLLDAAAESVDVIARRLERQRIDAERHAAMAGERHLARRDEQPAVRAVVIREDQLAVFLDESEESLQQCWIVEVGASLAERAVHLREDRPAEPVPAAPEVDQP